MAARVSPERAQKLAAAWLSGKYTKMSEVFDAVGISTSTRNQHAIRREVERMLGISLPRLNFNGVPNSPAAVNLPHRIVQHREEKPYTIVVFSDAHFWPGDRTPAYSILLQVIRDVKPDIILDNGDSFDGSSISRFTPSIWEDLPTLKDELAAVRERCDEIVEVAPKKAKLYRNLGNHDIRLEARLADVAPQLKGMPGTTIDEILGPKWTHQFAMCFNDALVVKHRIRGGIHARRNNAIAGMVSICTGHTHRLGITYVDSYAGRIYSMETGTLSQVDSPAFSYLEDNPRDWQSGFGIWHIDPDGPGGKPLLHPEVVEVKLDGTAFYGGKRYTP